MKTIFTSFYLSNYHPLTLLSYALEFRLYGLNPSGYHATSIGLHMLNSLLVWWLLSRLAGSVGAGFAMAVVFAVHPLRVESVAWAAERKDVLYAAFYLAACISYLTYVESKRWGACVLALAFFLLSLLSKSMAVTLPLVLLLFDFLRQRRFGTRLILEKVPFFALSMLFALLAVSAQVADNAVGHTPVWTRLCTATYSPAFYAGKLVFPVRLSALYPFGVPPDPVLPAQAWLGPLLVVGAGVLTVVTWRRARPVAFGVMFYFATLAPVLHVVPVSEAFASDRYTYIPMLGVLFAGGYGVQRLAARMSSIWRVAASCLFVVCVVVLASLTWRRCHVWKDGVSLFSDVLRQYPRCPVAWTNRAACLVEAGDEKQAMDDLNHSLEIVESDSAFFVRGALHASLGNAQSAIADCTRALEIDPNFVQPYLVRGKAYAALGKFDEGVRDLERACSASAVFFPPRYELGVLYLQIGQRQKAVAVLSEALALDPTHGPALLARGNAFLELGQYDRAIEDYDRAAQAMPDESLVLANRGTARAFNGDPARAIQDYTAALKLNPSNAQALVNRGSVYRDRGDSARAIADFTAAIRVDPDLAVAYRKRGRVHFSQKQYDLAIADFTQALRIQPDHREAREDRAQAYRAAGDPGSAQLDEARLTTATLTP